MAIVLRSLLFVPGNNYRTIVKAPKIDCDAVVFDLEDAVPIEDKETARIFVRDAIKELNFRQFKIVRVNSWDTGFTETDLKEIVQPSLDGIMLPKSESREDVEKLDRTLAELEKERGIKVGSIKIIPLIESHKGVINAYKIASASDRCIALAFGALDYYRTLGRTYFKFSETQQELFFARAMIVNSAKAAGLKAIDTPFLGLLVDREGLRRESELAWQLGFDGKLAIHPKHVEIINEVFTPSKEEIEQAMEIVKVYEEAKAQGLGATTLRGRMIDYATYVQAKEFLEIYEIIKSRETT